MGLIARLAAAVGITVKKVGSLELIALKDVDVFLSAAGTHNVAVIGIEGFRMKGDRAVPDMDAIADFSGLPRDNEMVAATIEDAKRFIVEVSRPDMYFDFALDEAEEKGVGVN